MKIVSVPVCVLLLAIPPVSAREVNESGAYIGGAAGATEFDDDGAFSALNFDDSDTSLEIYGGYKFFKYFSVEARLMDLGSYRVDVIDFDASAISVHAVGIIPFGESGWELFGQLGVGQISLDTRGVAGFVDEEEVIASAGIGVRFTPIRNFSMAVRIDAYAWEADTSLSQTYDVSIATTQFAMQYNF